MNILLVYTHPNHSSLNHAFMEKVLEGSNENNAIQQVQVLDLYEENFNPSLVFNTDRRRRDMHQDPDLEKYRQQILWADKLVFVYPIWWGRPPAMLLGYFDKLLASNFAYEHKGKISTKGLLNNKSVVCISTMNGPSGYLTLFMNNVHKVLMRKVTFNYVGIKNVKFFEFGGANQTPTKQQYKLNKVYRYFKSITV